MIAVLLQPFAAFLKLGHRPVVFLLHLGDGVGRPEEVGQFIDLRGQRMPEFADNHSAPVGLTCGQPGSVPQ